MACRACGMNHSPLMRCEVAAAINTPAINTDPINEEKAHVTKSVSRPSKGAGEISTNGRKREDYNAYMRDYMRARRARVPS